MIIYSLDISQERTGIAILSKLDVLHFDYIKRPKEKFKKVTFKDPEFSKWLLWYYDVMSSRLSEYSDEFGRPDYVIMEDMNMKFKFNSGKILMQFQAVAKMACANEFDLGVNLINNVTVKAALKIQRRKNLIPKEIKDIAKLNKVTPVKILMVDAVNEIWKLDLTYEQNDEADAIAQGYTFSIKTKGVVDEEIEHIL